MKKNHTAGLLSLLLLAVLLSLLVSALKYGTGGIAPGMWAPIRTAGLVFLALTAATVLFSARGHRLRIALMLAAGVALSILANRLHLSFGTVVLLFLALSALYILGPAVFQTFRFRKIARRFNTACSAYEASRDGAAYLAALDQLDSLVSPAQLIRHQELGDITFREYLACERIRVLENMERTEESRTLEARLRQETASPGLRSRLDRKAAESAMDTPPENSLE